MKLHPEYLPTPEQIAEACVLIRQQWTSAELKRRRMHSEEREEQSRWQPPQIDTSLCGLGVRNALSEV